MSGDDGQSRHELATGEGAVRISFTNPESRESTRIVTYLVSTQ